MFTVRNAVLIAATLLTAACSSDNVTTEPDDSQNPGSTPVANVAINPGAATLSPGQTRQLTVTLRSASNAVLNGRAISYTTDAPTVATVGQNGLVTAVGIGQAEITATSEGKSAHSTITVELVPVASIEINPDELAMDVGNSMNAAVVLRDAQNNVLQNREVTWSMNKPGVATVDQNGKVLGVTPGVATLTAASEGKLAQASVRVRAVVASVEIVGELDTLEAYEVKDLAAIARDANNNIIPGVSFNWTTSNPNIARVDNDAADIIGVDRGTVQITATSANGKSDVVTRVVVIRYRSITLGTQHACDISSGGIAWCWGLNSVNGRIGLAEVGDQVFRAAPNRVPGEHKFTQLVTYARTTCGLRQDGQALCWGTNNWNALGDGSNIPFSSAPVAVAGNHVFTKLVAGAEHACGLKATGSLYCWGHGDWGQIGNGNTSSAVAPVLAAGGMQFVDVAAGSAVTCGITSAGAAYCWGANSLGQLGIGGQIAYGNVFRDTPQAVVGGHQFRSITVGEQFTCAVDTNDKAWCWGIDGHRLGSGNSGDASSPRAVSGAHSFKWLDSGSGHSCGIDSQDNILCWGSNGFGQLGVAAAFSSVPVLAANSIKAVEVDVAGIGTGSGGFSCAISKDRLTTYCWGRNEFGQLGNGSTNNAASVNNVPTIVQTQKPL